MKWLNERDEIQCAEADFSVLLLMSKEFVRIDPSWWGHQILCWRITWSITNSFSKGYEWWEGSSLEFHYFVGSQQKSSILVSSR